MAGSDIRLRHARVATRVQFLGLGALFGLWGAHVPAVSSVHHLSNRGLGLLLFAAALGSGAMLLVAAPMVQRLGPRRAVRLSLGVACLGMSILLHAPGLPALLPLMLLIGAGWTLCDVAMNTEAALLEQAGGRMVMSGFHGMFSLGGMAAAAAVAAMLRLGWDVGWQFAIGALAAATAGWVASHWMLPDTPAPSSTTSSTAYRSAAIRAMLPRGPLLLLGVLGAVSMVAEGAMYDWSALYLQKSLMQQADLAALAYASFSAAMAATRFAGDALRERVAPRPLLIASGALAAGAMAAVLWLADPVAALIGFALVGVGLANVVPLLFIEAARLPGVPAAQGIAGVSAVSFLGFLIGPPAVAALAEQVGLSRALLLVVLAAGILALMARRLPSTSTAPSSPDSR